MTQIVLDNVSKRFPDGTVAVRDASFRVGDSEFFILVGPSGCGKSTLLNMIVGLEVPTEGEIRIDGKRVNELDARQRNMAMVFQNYAIYPHMTVRENLAFPLSVSGMDRADIHARVQRAAAMLELEDLLDRRPASLSGGQRQRVAMGRAIVREPAAFLLDEPLSNLDTRLRGQMRTEIARLQRRLGTTTIYVTHDQTEAMTLGERVAVLRNGTVQQVGAPRQLYESPRNLFVAAFIGSPPMNLFPARVDAARLVLPMASVSLPDALRHRLRGGGERLIAGIRPEHLQKAPRGTARPDEGRFRARIELVEWMGAEMYVHGSIDCDQDTSHVRELIGDAAGRADSRGRIAMVARMGTASEVAEDQDIELVLDRDRIHLFDAETGARLAAP